jgi:type IV pilus assembly protein PilC
MPMFAYESVNANGKLVRGRLGAANVADLEMRLKRMDLELIDGDVEQERRWGLRKSGVKRADLINFCFHMEQLASAGVPLLDGLGDLRDGATEPAFREIMADLIENIEGGLQLSAALALHPTVFDQTFVSLIRAGEHSGTLAEVFRHLFENIKWQDELASQTKKIIMYPSFVAVVVLCVTFFLMIYLVPQLTTFIRSMGSDLPFHTKALIFVSAVFVDYWYILLMLPIGAIIGAVVAVRHSQAARLLYDTYVLRVWMVGPILHKIILARFVTFFALMYGSGITVLECLRLSEGIVSNLAIAGGLRRAAQLISEGYGITAAFKEVGTFPPLVVRMLKVGESTGALEKALRNAGYFYDRDIHERIEKVQAVIEPIMTVILGLLLGWIMLSVLGPIYDTISKIKA